LFLNVLKNPIANMKELASRMRVNEFRTMRVKSQQECLEHRTGKSELYPSLSLQWLIVSFYGI
jgi:hypothetical protein